MWHKGKEQCGTTMPRKIINTTLKTLSAREHIMVINWAKGFLTLDTLSSTSLGTALAEMLLPPSLTGSVLSRVSSGDLRNKLLSSLDLCFRFFSTILLWVNNFCFWIFQQNP